MRIANYRRTVVTLAIAVAAVLVAVPVSGFLIFNRAPDDPLRAVDAIVVLGGEHDGRETYGVDLARQGYAPVVVLSNPYGAEDPLMRAMCRGRIDSIEIICKRPDPVTTRGEALMTKQLAAERNWSSVIIVTWRYHLPRATYVFGRCLHNSDISAVARAVPRQYDYSPREWAEVYLYQFGAYVKAFAQRSCP